MRISGLGTLALTGWMALVCAGPAIGQTARSANQEKFFGKWKLDMAQSKVAHAADEKLDQWRTYEPDGDRVKVAWGSGQGPLGTYSAKCDGTLEDSAGPAHVRCKQVALDKIDGEQLDDSDPAHRYYSRVVSRDGKTLSIIWFADAKRRHPTDRLVYTKDR